MDEASMKFVLEEVAGLRLAIAILANIMHESGAATRGDIAERMRTLIPSGKLEAIGENLARTADMIDKLDQIHGSRER